MHYVLCIVYISYTVWPRAWLQARLYEHTTLHGL